MIREETIDGRHAKVAYLDDDMNPVDVDAATRVKVIFADGDVWFGRAAGSAADAYDPDQPREPAGSPEGGRWAKGGGGELKSGSAEIVHDPGMLYHVTLTENVPSILKKGLLRFQTSQWVTPSGERYGHGEIYAFTDKRDALRWAAKQDWDMHKDTGSGKVSIVEFTGTGDWEVDTADPMSQAGKRGRWLLSQRPIKPEAIRSAKPFGNDDVKELQASFREPDVSETTFEAIEREAMAAKAAAEGPELPLVGGSGEAPLKENVFVKVAEESQLRHTDKDWVEKGGVERNEVIWTQHGSLEEIEQQANEAMRKLGDDVREYAVLIARAGPQADIWDDQQFHRGRRVMLCRGDECHVPFSQTVREQIHHHGTDTTSAFDLIHNHPRPLPLSIGDLRTLNKMPSMVSISERHDGGGWSKATIPGRTDGNPHGYWEDFEYETINYVRTLQSLLDNIVDPITLGYIGGPARHAHNILKERLLAGDAGVTTKDVDEAPIFIKQHSANLGLAAAGLIGYEYKLSPLQERWATELKKELDDAAQIATAEAKKIPKVLVDFR